MASFGVEGLIKEGTRMMSGVEEAVLKNIEACKALSILTRTSLGPNGRNKMIINRSGKVYVSSDGAVMLKELEVEHPAARLVVMAAEMQEREIGDATNLVVVLTGELLTQAAALLKMGLPVADVIAGYKKAGHYAEEIAEGLIVGQISDVHTVAELMRGIQASLSSKQFGYGATLARMVAEASTICMPKNGKHFNVDNIRVVKVLGGNVSDSYVMRGLAVKGDVESTCKHKQGVKVAVFAQAFDLANTETKGTVLIQKAEELLNFTKAEEAAVEKVVSDLADAGVGVVCAGGSFGALPLHYLEQRGMMAVRLASKFQVARLCKAVGAVPQLAVALPKPDHLGFAGVVSVDEVGGEKLTVFAREDEAGSISSIIVRGATSNTLDDLERTFDDGINNVKILTRDPRLLAGAGAFELELSRLLQSKADKLGGLEQYAVSRFAEALEVVPRTIAENSGLPAMDVLSSMYAQHSAGKTTVGVNAGSGTSTTLDAVAEKIFDPYLAKVNALRLATNTAATVLRVDQIIMARAAGGPKLPQGGARDDS